MSWGSGRLWIMALPSYRQGWGQSRLSEDVVDREVDVGEGFGSQNFSTSELAHARVSVRGGLAIRFDGLSREVDKPGFPDAGPRIHRYLSRAVLLHGALGDLNDEKEVGRPWMRLGIARQGRTEEGQVRLRLRVRSQRNKKKRKNNYRSPASSKDTAPKFSPA